MGTVYINYENLEDSIKRADKARNEISDYIDEIKRRITTPISNLNGSDSNGYASSAASLAQQKISKLNSISGKFVDYKSRVSNFISTAKTKDTHVSDKIDTIADLYIEERTWYEKIGDFLYETFCVDWANDTALGRLLMDSAKWVSDKAGNLLEDARDRFKYGAGKYVLNIIGAALGAIVAVAGVVVAIITFPATGTIGMVLLATTGVIAGIVSAIATVHNAGAEIVSNGKAFGLALDGDIGAARYYGNVDSVSEYWNRRDMGDAKTNADYADTGKKIDTAKNVADTVKLVTDVVSLGIVKDYSKTARFQNTEKWDFSKSNLKNNLLHEMGFYTNKINEKNVKFVDKIDMDEVVDLEKWFGGYSTSDFSRNGKLLIPEKLYKFFNGASIVDKTNGTLEAIVEIDGGLRGDKTTAVDWLKNISDVFSGFRPIGAISDIIGDGAGIVEGWGKWFNKYDPFGLKETA